MDKQNSKIIFLMFIFMIFLLSMFVIIMLYKGNENSNQNSNENSNENSNQNSNENSNDTDVVNKKDIYSMNQPKKLEYRYNCVNNSCEKTTDTNGLYKTEQDCKKECNKKINVYNVQYKDPYYPTSLYPSFVPFYGIRRFRRHPFRRDLNRRERRKIRRSIRRSIRR
jgi:hypothetical protein